MLGHELVLACDMVGWSNIGSSVWRCWLKHVARIGQKDGTTHTHPCPPRECNSPPVRSATACANLRTSSCQGTFSMRKEEMADLPQNVTPLISMRSGSPMPGCGCGWM